MTDLQRRARAFNAVGPTLSAHDQWLPLSVRQAVADAVLAALDEPVPAATEATELETTARVVSALYRSAEEAVTRVITLHEQWVAAGPPPLGVSVSRWWDKRLVELHNAIQPPANPTE
ncbi:hypothetical protein [Streptomyces sp. OM5714]|uniref:hypothetical protein n=1 Tax=Streptomyces sp. OM5714 TaxID=2602736 RepID=UPI0013DD225E|nr:hypothetical protein [Streptomyces sp. OM5714]KAF2774657.1 hypothetical protein STPH1_7702 [Streptomyces sp. OM5714]